MRLSEKHLTALQNQTDRVYATLPQRQPDAASLARCQLVAHRGDHDHTSIIIDRDQDEIGTTPACLENTLAAFTRCQQAGVFGIECDIQWSRNGVPMVIHDPDAGRVFAQPELRINQHSHTHITSLCDQIPTLQHVIETCCPALHLMLEIKEETWQPGYEATLAQCLKNFEPGRDYHLLCLNMTILDQLRQFDPACFLAVALTNTRTILNHVIQTSWPAMSGHYVLLNKRMRQRLQDAGKHWGTGFITSRRAAYREINSGSRWLFSNNAVRLQHEINELIDNKATP